jgi:hypothetical protein
MRHLQRDHLRDLPDAAGQGTAVSQAARDTRSVFGRDAGAQGAGVPGRHLRERQDEDDRPSRSLARSG